MLSDMQAYEIECSGDENAVAALVELQEARKKIAAAERIIEYAAGHPDMCCGKCSREIHEAEGKVATLKAALNAIWPDLGVARRRYPDDQYIEAAYTNTDHALRDAGC